MRFPLPGPPGERLVREAPVTVLPMGTRGTALPGHGGAVTRKLRKYAESALRDHADQKRLTAEELEQRTGLVRTARSNAEIDALFTDLPQPHPRFSVERMTVWVVLAGLEWFGVIGMWAVADHKHVWWPLGGAVALFLLLMTINGAVVARRVRRLRDGQQERQLEQLRREPFDQSGLRVGTKERQSAAMALVVHAAAGLSMRRYQEMYDQLASVRTRGELRAVLGDLPPPTPELAETVLSRDVDNPPAGLFAGLAVLAVFPGVGVAMTATWHHGQWYWIPAWAAAVVVMIVIQVRRTRARHAALRARAAMAR